MDRKEVVLEFEPRWFSTDLYYTAKLPDDSEVSEKIIEAAKRCERIDIAGTTLIIGADDLKDVATLDVSLVKGDMTEELLDKAMQRLQKELEKPTVKKVTLYVPVEA